jgi:hypothetical protein
MTEEQLRDLSRYRESRAFSEEERLVIQLAEKMSGNPVQPPSELLEALRLRFDEAQLVELSAAIAWENYRARFNRVFGVRPVGFCKEGTCQWQTLVAERARQHILEEQTLDQLSSAAHPHLLEDAAEVILHRVLGDKERR